MKYTTKVKSALALAMGLMVGVAFAAKTEIQTNQVYGATFEGTAVENVNDYAYTPGDKISAVDNEQPKYRDETAGTGWFVGSVEDDESAISNRLDAAGGHMLWLNTDSNTLTNKFANSTDVNDAIAGGAKTGAEYVGNVATYGGAYFETEVKFVASDDPKADIAGGADATKFAIYAYHDDADESNPTNLVVFHAYFDNTLNDYVYTNEVFRNVYIDTTKYTKVRVEMKRTTDGYNDNIFSVSIDGGSPITSDLAVDGCWFYTAEDRINNLTSVSSLNFKGTGEIDNVKVGQIVNETYEATLNGVKYASFATAAAALTPADAFVAFADGSITLADGQTYNIDTNGFAVAVSAGTGYKAVYEDGAWKSVQEAANVATVISVAGVTIGNYPTLAEALSNAVDGATVKILSDISLDARVEPNVGANTAITIDLDGYTITRTGISGNGSVFDVKSGDVVISNGVINCTQNDTAIAADGVYAITSRSGSNVTLADLVVLVNSECGACAYPFAGSTMTIDSGAYSNLTQTAYRYNTAITGMAVNQPNNATQNLFIKGGTFSQYDPQLGDDSGAMTDFTDEGFVAIADGNGGWVVQPGYNVTFDADGGTPAPEAQRVADGGKATAPADPAKEGATFDGWTLNGAAFDFDTVLDADIELVASWTEIVPTYTVTFMVDETQFAVSNDIPRGAVVAAPDPAPTKADDATYSYTFRAWQLGGVDYVFATGVTSNFTLVADFTATEIPPAGDDYDEENGDTVNGEAISADVAAWLNIKKNGATKAAFEATLDNDGLTLTQEYLLNTDPTVATTVEFKINSIAVGSTVDLQVVLTRTEASSAVTSAINGTVKIKGAATVDGTYTDAASLTDKFDEATTATKSFSTEAKFFKAVIE